MSSKPVVFSDGALPDDCLDILSKECVLKIWTEERPIPRTELLNRVKGVDALFIYPVSKIDSELLDAAGIQLKVIATSSVGLEHVDVAECKRRGIPVGYTPGILTSAVAELTIALLLATCRRLKESFRAVHDGTWGTRDCGMWMTGATLEGKTLGIVGLGRIGCAAVKRLKPFEFSRILYCGRNKSEHEDELGVEYVDFYDLLKQSDFVVATCSVHAGNKGMFDKEAFKVMKRTSIFINMSRGTLVNEDDLYDALTTGEIGAAGLDVTNPEPMATDHRLLQLSNVTVTPHIGSATTECRSAMFELTARNILAGLKGQPLPSPVVL